MDDVKGRFQRGDRALIGGIVLAGGAARRFRTATHLAPFNGRPTLEYAIRAMAATPVRPLVVVLGSGGEHLLDEVDLHGAETVVCDRCDGGQSASLACGLAQLGECDAVVVTLGDQPRMPADAIRRVIGRRGGGALAVRATYGGAPGHPVLLEHELFERLRDVTGDHGARSLLMRVPVRNVPCDDLGGGEDLDALAQLDALGSGGPVR